MKKFMAIYCSFWLAIAIIICAWVVHQSSPQNGIGNSIGAFLICLICSGLFYLYILPSIIAWQTGHQLSVIITLINLSFGLTGIVWLLLLLAALGMIFPKLAGLKYGKPPSTLHSAAS